MLESVMGELVLEEGEDDVLERFFRVSADSTGFTELFSPDRLDTVFETLETLGLDEGIIRSARILMDQYGTEGVHFNTTTGSGLVISGLRAPDGTILHAKLPKEEGEEQDPETRSLNHAQAKPFLPVFVVHPYAFEEFPDSPSALLLKDVANPLVVSPEQRNRYLDLQRSLFERFEDHRGRYGGSIFFPEYLQLTLYDVLYHRFMREHSQDPVYVKNKRGHLSHDELMDRALKDPSKLVERLCLLSKLEALVRPYTTVLKWLVDQDPLGALTIINPDRKEEDCLQGSDSRVSILCDFDQAQVGCGAEISLVRSRARDSHAYALPYIFFDTTLDALAEKSSQDYGLGSGLTLDDVFDLRERRLATHFIGATRNASAYMELGNIEGALLQLSRAYRFLREISSKLHC